jgi:UrcA family protein
MMTSTVMTLTRRRYPSFTLPVAIAAVGLFGLGNPAQAQEMDQVAVVSSSTGIVGYRLHEPRPVKQTNVKVSVTYDPVTLTTNSGIALLRDAVKEAAQKACKPSSVHASLYDDLTYHDCVQTAIDRAEPQVAQAITDAHRAESG